ncbi:MAG: hypothetical protein A2161_01515 [Candidatus Schekmanbacteria bacterium RBG_13_48_7]|uniref:Uncharacterized protein n=1 Tax=Candidatus Schekmanbacteria bacterium RBG_13_48_7 TaxID=1817878 RepID=A0A1F7RV68_9BACT|nr:MAG: hypothetical protein A2161_01515 [Candidatus Schekmanbacteria bacterium RBG_13_48_7]
MALKIALIVPSGGYYANRWQKGSLMPPLGIGYIAAVLEQQGHRVTIVDAYAENMTNKQLIFCLEQLAPDVAGVTFTTENRFEAFETIKLCKQTLPECKTMAGGPHVSLAAEDTLSNIQELDYIIRGEGEKSVVELCQVIEGKGDIESVNGVTYRKNGTVIHNPDMDFIVDLDSLPFPARHLYNTKKYNFFMDVPGRGKLSAANIMTSRGCPFHCMFCASTINWGSRFRFRSPENILEEIIYLKNKFGVQSIWFFDDTFTANRKQTEKLCEMILEKDLNISWFCEIRVDTVDFELLKKMKEAGCYFIGFGIESGSQRILDEVIGKKIKLEQVENIRTWSKELNIIANPFFILSHPTESYEEGQATMELMEKWSKDFPVSLSLMHVYPGTKLEKLAYKKKILPEGFSWATPEVKGVITLPGAQGNVPIFVDKLEWNQITEMMVKWASKQKYSIWKRIPKVFRSIRSYDDAKLYLTMAVVYFKLKINLFLGRFFNNEIE